MDNVIQNISIEDIIPSNFQPTQEEKRKIDELAQLIKVFGIIDPIIVRPKNGKYEIVLGIDNYEAAKIAKINNIPAIIKEIDDETFSKYLNVDSNKLSNENNIPPSNTPKKVENNNRKIPLQSTNNTESLSPPKWQNNGANENLDIVNLKELSKERIEYERDDLKMNNGELNNNMMINNNLEPTQPNTENLQGPTFGGRFFPSLEDEPTNMNMIGTNPVPSPITEVPNMNNNLIDLTDLTIEKEPMAPTVPDLGSNIGNNQVPEINPSINNFQMPQSGLGMTPQAPIQNNPPLDNIISLESLQNNNPVVQPSIETTPMATLEADFGVPTSNIIQPQFEMPQNILPQMPEITPTMNNFQVPQTDFGFTGPTMMPQPEIPYQPAPTPMQGMNNDFDAPVSMQSTSNIIPAKDVTPVINTIKNLVSNLEAFGYRINVNEEDLINSIKLNIEVEK